MVGDHDGKARRTGHHEVGVLLAVDSLGNELVSAGLGEGELGNSVVVGRGGGHHGAVIVGSFDGIPCSRALHVLGPTGGGVPLRRHMLQRHRSLHAGVCAGVVDDVAVAVDEVVVARVGVAIPRRAGERVERVLVTRCELDPVRRELPTRRLVLRGGAVNGIGEVGVGNSPEPVDPKRSGRTVFGERKAVGRLARIVVVQHVDDQLEHGRLVAAVAVGVPVVGA